MKVRIGDRRDIVQFVDVEMEPREIADLIGELSDMLGSNPKEVVPLVDMRSGDRVRIHRSMPLEGNAGA